MPAPDPAANTVEIHPPSDPRPYKGALGVISYASGKDDQRLVGYVCVCTSADGMGSTWTTVATGDVVRTSSSQYDSRVSVNLLAPGQQITITAGFKE